jgi:ketosteroid isomerase-like protein
MKLYDEESVFVGETGHPAQGLPAIRQRLRQFLALKLPVTVMVRNVYQTGDVALMIFDWVIEGKAADGKAVMLVGTSSDVLRRQSVGHWILVVDNPFGTAGSGRR